MPARWLDQTGPAERQTSAAGERHVTAAQEALRLGFRFQEPVDIPGPVKDADDLDAVRDRSVKDEVLLESPDPPDPQAFQARIGRRSPLAKTGHTGELLERRGGGIIEA